MSLLSDLKQKLLKMSLVERLLAIVILPVTLFITVLKIKKSIDDFFENTKRTKVDEKSKELDTKIQQNHLKTAEEEGKLELIQENKEKAVKTVDTQDPVSFHNSRKKS